MTGHLLAGVIYRALADVLPDRVIAECGAAPSMRALFSGVDRNGDRFSQVLFATGGSGLWRIRQVIAGGHVVHTRQRRPGHEDHVIQ